MIDQVNNLADNKDQNSVSNEHKTQESENEFKRATTEKQVELEGSQDENNTLTEF